LVEDEQKEEREKIARRENALLRDRIPQISRIALKTFLQLFSIFQNFS